MHLSSVYLDPANENARKSLKCLHLSSLLMLTYSIFHCWATNPLDTDTFTSTHEAKGMKPVASQRNMLWHYPSRCKDHTGISITHVKHGTAEVFKCSALLKPKFLPSFDCSKSSSYLTFQGDCEIRFKRKALQSSVKLFGQGDVGLQYGLGQAVQGFQLAQLVSSLPLSHLWGFKHWNFNGVEWLWEICVFRAFIFHSGLYTLSYLPKIISSFYQCIGYLLMLCPWLKFINTG